MGQVEDQGLLSIETVAGSYGSVYEQSVVFDLVPLGVGPESWIWTLLADLVAESRIAAVEDDQVRNMHRVINILARHPEGRRLLAQPARVTSAADLRRLFQLSEEVVAEADAPTLGRGRVALRSFVFARAHAAPFAEPIDQQRVRFRPRRPLPKGEPRPLISDLHDITDPNANLPVGALAAPTAKQVTAAVKERAEHDLERIRLACIADMTAAAALRRRAIQLRRVRLHASHCSIISDAMHNSKTAARDIARKGIPAHTVLTGVLKIIRDEKLATARATVDSYAIPFSEQVTPLFLDGLAEFKSRRLFEIEHRACVEELFAAFHLLQTHVGWNWSSVSALQADEIDLGTAGVVVLQSAKSKTDDDTPVRSIDLSEPGIRMAIEILLWNREQLVKCGFFHPSEQVLWATRPRPNSKQRKGYFHPVLRLNDFIARHGLPKYSLEQVRTQVLFTTSLTAGGIEAARLQGGHKSYGATQRYVGNIVQDRISSSLNLEFSKKLEAEIIYLYRGGARISPDVALLKPIGDGASCSDPTAPPLGRSRTPGSCPGESCHSDGGCPNRRIAVDDPRVEEVLRLNRHFTQNWQRLMQANPERFVVNTLPQMAFNAALLLALQRGPYAARVAHIGVTIGMP